MALSFKKRKKSWQRNKISSKVRLSFLPRRRNSVKIIKRIIFIVSVFLIIYFFFFSHFFLMEKIEIEGNKNIFSRDIETIISNKISQPIFGFIPGNNFFLNKSEEIEEILKNEFSEIKSAEINKKFPNLLKVKIIEKNPLIIWCRLGDCYYMDNNGMAFLSAEKNIFAEKGEKFIKIMEQLEIEEELEDKSGMNETESSGAENKKKNDLTYKLNAEQFEKIRLFFTREKQDDWVSAYPDLFAIAGEDLGLPILSDSLRFAKKIVDDLKRIEAHDGKKIFQIRVDFNYENESIFVNVIEEDEEKKEKEISFEPIKINDQVSDGDFINFTISIDAKIKNSTTLNINYYKTKGTKCRELIAYTDKNTRIYFNTTDDADLQVNNLKDFLLKGIDRKKIDSLEYIYLKSGNKIFYK